MPDLSANRLDPGRDCTAWMELWQASGSRFLVQHPEFGTGENLAAERTGLGIDEHEGLVFAVAFDVQVRRGLTCWLSPFFTPFSGPLAGADQVPAPPAKAERFWRDRLEAIDAAIPRSVDIAEIVFPPGLADVRALVWRGWRARPVYHYVTAWQADDSWRDSLESSVRRQEKKALKDGLVFRTRPALETADLRRLWSLNATRQGLDSPLRTNLGALGNWLCRREWGFLAEVLDRSERVHAAALIGHDKQRVYYLAGASDPEHLGSGAPTLLHTGILEEIERRELPRRYDWVGANTPNIARFKRGFGPHLEISIAVRRHSRKARWMETLKSLIKP